MTWVAALWFLGGIGVFGWMVWVTRREAIKAKHTAMFETGMRSASTLSRLLAEAVIADMRRNEWDEYMFDDLRQSIQNHAEIALEVMHVAASAQK